MKYEKWRMKGEYINVSREREREREIFYAYAPPIDRSIDRPATGEGLYGYGYGYSREHAPKYESMSMRV